MCLNSHGYVCVQNLNWQAIFDRKTDMHHHCHATLSPFWGHEFEHFRLPICVYSTDVASLYVLIYALISFREREVKIGKQKYHLIFIYPSATSACSFIWHIKLQLRLAYANLLSRDMDTMQCCPIKHKCQHCAILATCGGMLCALVSLVPCCSIVFLESVPERSHLPIGRLWVLFLALQELLFLSLTTFMDSI